MPDKASSNPAAWQNVHIADVQGIRRRMALALFNEGIRTLGDAWLASREELISVPGVGQETLCRIWARIEELSSKEA